MKQELIHQSGSPPPDLAPAVDFRAVACSSQPVTTAACCHSRWGGGSSRALPARSAQRNNHYSPATAVGPLVPETGCSSPCV